MRSEKLMYNCKQKQEYIDFENSNQESLRNYFRRLSDKEVEYSKDIADMGPDELRNTLEFLNIRREETRGHLLSLLRGYIDWAKLYEKTSNDSIIHAITPESIDAQNAITTQMIRSPEHLEEIFDKGIEKKDGQFLMPNRAARDMLVFWLAYSGMTLKEICTLKTTDIDGETVVTKQGQNYEINEKILTLWKITSSATYIEKRNGKASKSGKNVDNDTINYELLDSTYLFKVIRGTKEKEVANLNVAALAIIILKVCDKYTKLTSRHFRVSPENIRLSGIFYKLYKMEQEGKEVSIKEFAKLLDKNYSDLDDTDLLIKMRKWRKDFENWKLAFGYM